MRRDYEIEIDFNVSFAEFQRYGTAVFEAEEAESGHFHPQLLPEQNSTYHTPSEMAL